MTKNKASGKVMSKSDDVINGASKSNDDKKSSLPVADELLVIKKHLPNIDLLINEYDIPTDHLSYKTVLAKMLEAPEHYVRILTQIMQPEDFTSLHECTIFTDAEKADIFKLYKQLMILHRGMLKSLIKNDDDDLIIMISRAHNELEGLKHVMLDVVQKLQDSWTKTETNGRIKYFG